MKKHFDSFILVVAKQLQSPHNSHQANNLKSKETMCKKKTKMTLNKKTENIDTPLYFFTAILARSICGTERNKK